MTYPGNGEGPRATGALANTRFSSTVDGSSVIPAGGILWAVEVIDDDGPAPGETSAQMYERLRGAPEHGETCASPMLVIGWRLRHTGPPLVVLAACGDDAGQFAYGTTRREALDAAAYVTVQRAIDEGRFGRA